MSISSCTTILRTPARIAVSSLLAFSMAACNPSSTTNTGPTINQFGGDKNDPGGYEGSGGTGDGGGGQGILCSADTKNPALKSKLLVRDIFEAIHNSKLEIKELKSANSNAVEVSDEAIAFLIASLKTYFGPATPHLEVGDEKFWREFVTKISFISDDAALYPSQDANSPIALPAGCKIAQIAYWDDSVGEDGIGTLYVDKNHWQKLDQVNKVALLAHEYYFKQARKAGAKNSDSVRGKIGRIFSRQGPEPLFKNWEPAKDDLAKDIIPNSNEGFKFCRGTLADDPKASLHMFQYEGKDGNQYFVFPHLSSTAITLNSLQNQVFVLDQKNDSVIAASNLLLYRAGRFFDKNADEKYPFFDSESEYINSGIMKYRVSPTADVGMMPMNDVNPSTKTPKVSSFIDGLINAPTVVWADGLRTSQGVLQLALLNPYRAQNKKNAYVPPQELATMIQKDFLEKLKSRLHSVQWSNAQADLIAMIKVLHADLKKAQRPNTPPNFESFKEAYREFIYKHSRYNPNLFDEENKSSDPFKLTDLEKNREEGEELFRLVEDVPDQMLKASMNLISINDTDLARSTDSAGDNTGGQGYDGFKIRVALNDRQVEFGLNCDDFDKVYADRLDKNSILLSSKTFLEDALSYTFEKEKITAINGPDSEQVLARFENFLGTLSSRIPTMYGRDMDAYCDAQEYANSDECKFRHRLQTAKKFRVEACSYRFMRKQDFDAADKTPNLCTIINFPEDGSNFIVWGTSNDYGNNLELVKQIAPAGRYWKH